MPPDQIVGTAVLQNVVESPGSPPVEHLMVCCMTHRSGRPVVHFGMIPICPVGAAGDRGWRYSETGDVLGVTPSVMMSKPIPVPGREAEFPKVAGKLEIFHNAGSWCVKFVRYSALPDEVKAREGAYDVWRRLNVDLLVHEADL